MQVKNRKNIAFLSFTENGKEIIRAFSDKEHALALLDFLYKENPAAQHERKLRLSEHTSLPANFVKCEGRNCYTLKN